jgi:hypothetical protein
MIMFSKIQSHRESSDIISGSDQDQGSNSNDLEMQAGMRCRQGTGFDK